jgi:4-amino-4-deoxy-L-arabinose transferase-like glycosyltransferase
MKIFKAVADSKIEKFFLLTVFCVSLFLFLGNLGNQYLWDDEAQTALISKTILTCGIPKGYDGKNCFSQTSGAEYGKDYIWKWHPWFQFYVLAVFFKLFGFSAFVARLPFALFGMACVFLNYYFCKELWGDKRTAALAAILLLFLVPFLILSRQCRYYAPSAFFSLLGLYGYVRIIKDKKSSVIVLAVAAILLFHTQFVFCVILLVSILFHAVIFNRHKLIRLLTLSAVIAVIFPWLIWVYNPDYRKVYPDICTFRSFTISLYFYFSSLVKNNLSLLLLLVPLIVVIFARRTKFKELLQKDVKIWANLLLLLVYVIASLIILSLLSYAPFYRNLVALIPVLTVITAFILMLGINANKIIGTALVVILITTGSLHNYLYEITHDYDGPIEGIVNYLNSNGSSDDMVAITYGDMPLKFYTKMRVIGGLTGENPSPAKQANWVILRKYFASEKDLEVKKYLVRNIQWDDYKGIMLNYPDIAFENREDPDMHYFRTVTDEDRVVIFHKIR